MPPKDILSWPSSDLFPSCHNPDRRRLLLGGAAAWMALLGFSARAYPTTHSRHEALLSSARSGSQDHRAVAWSPQQGILWSVALAGRGHGVAISPDHQYAFLPSRRPGTWATLIDLKSGKEVRSATSTSQRHFFGHALYNPNGRYVLTTENAFDRGEGVIGVRDARTLQHIREFPSFGIEPHEMAWMPDGHTLVVANGGILTHPDSGRAKLNLGMLEPSLAYINSRTGELIEKHALPSHLTDLSTRHVAVSPSGTVCVVCQYQGPTQDKVPLVIHHRPGEDLLFPDFPEALVSDLRQYCGSVVFSPNGQHYAFTSPKGGLAVVVPLHHQGSARSIPFPDVCGATRLGQQLVLTSGFGSLLSGSFGDFTSTSYTTPVQWDNHAASFLIPSS